MRVLRNESDGLAFPGSAAQHHNPTTRAIDLKSRSSHHRRPLPDGLRDALAKVTAQVRT
jgi:hypothetical protein